MIKRVCAAVSKSWDLIDTGILNILLSSLLVLVFLEVLVRYVADLKISGIETLAIVVAAWSYYLGAARASKAKAQITVTILEAVPLPSQVKEWLGVISRFIALGVCVATTYYLIDYCIWVHTEPMVLTPFTNVSLDYLTFSFLIGFLLMSIYYLQQTIEQIRSIFKPKHRD